MSKKKQYPPRKPRYAAGIKLQDARGTASRSWWAKRWLDTIASKTLGGRFGRGRAYAMTGQVVGLADALSCIEADVIGVRPDPYHVKIVFRSPTGDARDRIVSRIRSEPMLVARLMSDELPTEIEGFFRDEGYDLFPGGKLAPDEYDMTTSCTCPDYANPCKHSFAVLLVYGEEIARHPAKLLALRGITFDDLIKDVTSET